MILGRNKILETPLLKLALSVLLLTVGLALAPLGAWADNDNSHQFSELTDDSGGTVQEENVQGRTITALPENQFSNTIDGTDKPDTILGSPADDLIHAKGGDDLVMANEGNDRVFGSSGDDLLQCNLGNDKIDGEGRNDVIIGGDFDDILSGGDGDDSLFGGPGNDVLKGGEGKNRFVCADGVDTVLDYNPSKGDTISGDCEVVHRV
jgi:Ca2+-binding RTX toxin-like protein